MNKYKNILHENQSFKNYIELCSLLGWRVTTGTAKMAQMKELSCYCQHHKKGNKIIIDGVYDEPKLENKPTRGGNNNSKYADLMDYGVLHLVNRKKYFNQSFNEIFTLHIPLINKFIWQEIGYDAYEIAEYNHITKGLMREYYDITKSTLKSAFESSLNRENFILTTLIK